MLTEHSWIRRSLKFEPDDAVPEHPERHDRRQKATQSRRWSPSWQSWHQLRCCADIGLFAVARLRRLIYIATEAATTLADQHNERLARMMLQRLQ